MDLLLWSNSRYRLMSREDVLVKTLPDQTTEHNHYGNSCHAWLYFYDMQSVAKYGNIGGVFEAH